MKLALQCVLTFLIALSSCVAQDDVAPTHDSSATSPISENPSLLAFDDLIALASTARPEGPLGARLDRLLHTPFVQRDTGAIEPRRPIPPDAGPILRFAEWNIERGLNLDLIQSALTDSKDYSEWVEAQSLSLSQKTKIESQVDRLHGADILVLNEVDWGIKRTNYKNIAADLANALHMNYAYGVEFVELDPVFDLDIERVDLTVARLDQQPMDDQKVDRGRYLGLHGTAILSRYPIANARMVRLPVCYDWYGQEYKAISKLEMGRRWSVDKLFRERIERELRQGGRMALIAEISIPDLPNGMATVVATHFENRCKPACRGRQMKALLADLKQDTNPLVMAGDLNTTGGDNTPTSIGNEIKARVAGYKFWARQAVSHFHPLGAFQYALLPLYYYHGYKDPTAMNLPVVWDHPERSLFKHVEGFRFADGRTFDFRGDPLHTYPIRGRTLADSNQRGGKGFVPTYKFSQDWGGTVGQFKLDWIFVKPFIENPRSLQQSRLFAPQFPVTMRELNQPAKSRVSDHAPITVDLPLTEPNEPIHKSNPRPDGLSIRGTP